MVVFSRSRRPVLEFTDRHIDELKAFQPHFAGVIRRLAGDHESRLINSSFRRFMSKLTTATIVLDWNLKVVHANGAATQMCLRWERGDQAKSLKARRTFRLPPDLNRALDGLKSSISASTGEEKARVRQGQMVVANRKTPMFKALIEFLPSRSLALSKGTFLITFNEDSTGPNEIASRLQFLTPRERECAMLAASGMRNTEIAKQLGKSGITVRNQLTTVYRKLGVTSRLKLIAALGQSHHG